MKRIRHTDTRVVDGVTFEIDYVETLEYDGEWRFCCYDIKWNGHIRSVYGCPIDTYLRQLKESLP